MATNLPVGRITAKPREPKDSKALQLATIWPAKDKDGEIIPDRYSVSFAMETDEYNISLKDFLKAGGSAKGGSFYTSFWTGKNVTLSRDEDDDL